MKLKALGWLIGQWINIRVSGFQIRFQAPEEGTAKNSTPEKSASDAASVESAVDRPTVAESNAEETPGGAASADVRCAVSRSRHPSPTRTSSHDTARSLSPLLAAHDEREETTASRNSSSVARPGGSGLDRGGAGDDGNRSEHSVVDLLDDQTGEVWPADRGLRWPNGVVAIAHHICSIHASQDFLVDCQFLLRKAKKSGEQTGTLRFRCELHEVLQTVGEERYCSVAHPEPPALLRELLRERLRHSLFSDSHVIAFR